MDLTCRQVHRTAETDALPVVFLHGFGGLSSQWEPLQLALSHLTSSLAYDLPGHGGALNYPGFGPPKVAARAVIADLSARCLDRVHLVGHSMGGAISSLVALFDPQRVASLTLLAPGGFGPEIDQKMLEQWAGAQTHEEFAQLLPHFFAPGFHVSEEMITPHVKARSQPGAGEALQKIAREVFVNGKQGMLPLDALLALDVPLSLIWGTLDSIIPVSHALPLEGRVDLHIVEDMGHMPVEEQPELVKKVILQHLRADL